jgi:hypothetical protein
MRAHVWFVAVLLIVGTVAPRAERATQDAPATSACAVSQTVTDRPPDDPHASSFASPRGTWYANNERTVWAWWWGNVPPSRSFKVLWVRPAGAQLRVSGRRLDGPSDPLTAYIPEGYPWTYQASGLSFPTPGCWQVEATVENARLEFVVQVP